MGDSEQAIRRRREKWGSGKKTPEREKDQAKRDSGKRAAQTRQGKPRESGASLETQTKFSLLKEARSRDIKGRSSMSKAELVAALRGKGG